MYEQLSIEDFQEQFVNNEEADYALIDVREPEEFIAGRIPGAILIPMGEIQFRMDEIDEDKPVILVCKTGVRSDVVAQALAANGYDNVYNLMEGTLGWARRGLNIERGE